MPTYRLLGIDDEQTTCDHCGKRNLKCTAVLAVLDADGNEEAEVRFGRDCAARALGRRGPRAQADRIEIEARGIAGAALHAGIRNSEWTKFNMAPENHRFPTYGYTVERDGHTVAMVPTRYHLDMLTGATGRAFRYVGPVSGGGAALAISV